MITQIGLDIEILHNKLSQLWWLKMKLISYVMSHNSNGTHIWSLYLPTQIKAKIKHYIRIHACGCLLFSCEVMCLCWDLLSCLTGSQSECAGSLWVSYGVYELGKAVIFTNFLNILTFKPFSKPTVQILSQIDFLSYIEISLKQEFYLL